MPKTIFDWNSKSRNVSYMCRICGKKYGSHAMAKTCEWADLKGITRKATTANKRAKERRKENEDNISNQLKRRSGEDNNINQCGSDAG
jgi:hypothetical protein